MKSILKEERIEITKNQTELSTSVMFHVMLSLIVQKKILKHFYWCVLNFTSTHLRLVTYKLQTAWNILTTSEEEEPNFSQFPTTFFLQKLYIQYEMKQNQKEKEE